MSREALPEGWEWSVSKESVRSRWYGDPDAHDCARITAIDGETAEVYIRCRDTYAQTFVPLAVLRAFLAECERVEGESDEG